MNATLKLMTFNLRYDRPDPGVQNWQMRKEAIAELIHHYQPDLMGTQELKPHQLSELKDLLPDYKTIGGDRRGDGTDEYCAIFYHQSKINCLETEDFYLSETPTIAGSITPHWDNYAPRMVTWGRFKIDNSERSLILLNTHFAHLSHKARELSAELIIRYCDRFPLEESYLFLTGDFNALPNSKEREILKHPLRDRIHFQDTLESLPMKDQKTFHGFTGKATTAIDTIYYDRRVKLQDIAIDKKRWQGVFPSDHFPIIANFILP